MWSERRGTEIEPTARGNIESQKDKRRLKRGQEKQRRSITEAKGRGVAGDGTC